MTEEERKEISENSSEEEQAKESIDAPEKNGGEEKDSPKIAVDKGAKDEEKNGEEDSEKVKESGTKKEKSDTGEEKSMEEGEESETDEEESETDGEEEESVEIVDEKSRPKIKPVLPPEIKKKLEMKKARKLPEFKRQEWFRYRRLGERWRRPRGLHSKMRRHMKYRPPVVRVGYRTPVEVRGLHPSGFSEVLVYNPSQLEGVNPEREAVRIARTVGTRKRIEIIERADTLNIRVLNRRGF